MIQKNKTAGVFFFFLTLECKLELKKQIKTKKALVHRNCFRVNVILYLTVCKGWGELAHATAWMLFILISTLSLERLDCFYFHLGSEEEVPHHPMSAKPSAKQVCFPLYESVALPLASTGATL